MITTEVFIASRYIGLGLLEVNFLNKVFPAKKEASQGRAIGK